MNGVVCIPRICSKLDRKLVLVTRVRKAISNLISILRRLLLIYSGLFVRGVVSGMLYIFYIYIIWFHFVLNIDILFLTKNNNIDILLFKYRKKLFKMNSFSTSISYPTHCIQSVRSRIENRIRIFFPDRTWPKLTYGPNWNRTKI